MRSMLIINSGSSTIKFSVFSIQNNSIKKEYNGLVDRITTDPIITIKSVTSCEKFEDKISVFGDKENHYKLAVEFILRWVKAKGLELKACGHRIVHGGPNYSAPILLDDKNIAELSALSPAVPLHQPYNIKGVMVLKEELPDIPEIACFDTAFHATCNPIWQQYALPKEYTETGLRRYGFHGSSYEFIANTLPKLMSCEESQGKFIVAHLGNGASMCAIHKQKSVATTLGFSAIGGLPMGTRIDSVDAGAVLYLIDNFKLNTDQIREIFYRKSGLLGVSELSSDMRDLLASDKEEAKLAIDIFVNRIYTHAGMLAAEMHGLDGFIFTGGIGENAYPVREAICKNLGWLGVELDAEKNAHRIAIPTKISSEKSKIPVWVIPADEETVIAEHTFRLAFL